MQWPSLSVIIPLKNTEKYLAMQLDALRAQEYPGVWEVVVVDNGSTDNSENIAEQAQHKFSNLRCIRAVDKSGVGYVRNMGTKEAKRDFFVFVDADDVVAEGFLRAYGDAFRDHDLVAGALETESLNQLSPWRFPPFTGSRCIALGYKPFIIGCNMGISRRAFQDVGGFDEDCMNGEDVELSWRLQLKGYEIIDAPGAVLHYRFRDSIGATFRQTVAYAEAHVELYQRYARYGMPRSSTRGAIGNYWWLVMSLPRFLFLWAPQERERWLHKAAECWGRARASVLRKTLYL